MPTFQCIPRAFELLLSAQQFAGRFELKPWYKGWWCAGSGWHRRAVWEYLDRPHQFRARDHVSGATIVTRRDVTRLFPS